jgi:hypothetical protein
VTADKLTVNYSRADECLSTHVDAIVVVFCFLYVGWSLHRRHSYEGQGLACRSFLLHSLQCCDGLICKKHGALENLSRAASPLTSTTFDKRPAEKWNRTHTRTKAQRPLTQSTGRAETPAHSSPPNPCSLAQKRHHKEHPKPNKRRQGRNTRGVKKCCNRAPHKREALPAKSRGHRTQENAGPLCLPTGYLRRSSAYDPSNRNV